MEKTAAEKRAADLSIKSAAAAREALAAITKSEDAGDVLVCAATASAYASLALLHKMDQIYEQQERQH